MYGKIQESGLTEIFPLIYISVTWGQYPVLSHPESSQGAPFGAAAAVDCQMVGILFSSWVPSGIPIGEVVAWWLADDQWPDRVAPASH